ncbi:MATE family efflux transporter [Pseudomonas sp. R5(2019)]|uniref:MATE family efflux transporter n=1 Tax=Pseudomonas sp. R5(2019) TaxID=2697566 RepID=UPI0014130BBF|nr:MATE family efflux transporter [Pseudomonas sp. R5(2019)]NBA94887.1 MATE family efflux transporter [Pseudomonas sp. R5(2019)]
MMIAKLAGPLIISRLGEMVSSFLYLAFVGHVIPDALGHASFAWALISLATVVGIGFYSVLIFEVAGTHNGSNLHIMSILSTAVKLAFFLGSCVTSSVFLYLILCANELENLHSDSGKVMAFMSMSIPAIYLQIVIFNYFNALNQPKLELFFVWTFNIVFLLACLTPIIFESKVNIIGFVATYAFMRWALVITALVLLSKKHKIKFSLYFLQAVSAKQYKNFILKGAPFALCFGAESFLYFTLSVIAKNMGAPELSAYQASLHFLSVIYMISIGVGNATAILTAKPHVEGKISEVKAKCIEGLIFGAVLLVPCLFLCLYFSDSIARLYSSDEMTKTLIAENIKIAIPYLVFEYVYIVIRMVLRSLGDYWLPTILTIICLNVLGLAASWILFEFYEHSVKSIFVSLVACSFVLMLFLLWRLSNRFHKTPIMVSKPTP